MPYRKFKAECATEIARQGADTSFRQLSQDWMNKAEDLRYTYHFEWLGRPIIQFPQDMVMVQELVWTVRPDLIIETGIAHGGSLIYSASLLELCALCGGPAGARVLGIDIDIRAHNRQAIIDHPLSRRIDMIEGSSIDDAVVAEAAKAAARHERVMVLLDSNHTHAHVLAELCAYGPLVTPGSYCVVFDTAIAHSDADFSDRPWNRNDNPLTAVRAFLATRDDFEVDAAIDARLGISEAPGGYLKRVK